MWGHSIAFRILILMLVFLAGSCSSARDHQVAYRRAWQKIVNSQAWRDALVSNGRERPGEEAILYNLPAVYDKATLKVETGSVIDDDFLNTYRSLVFRAYFRTIAEAERADGRIYDAYRRLREQRHLREKRRDSSYREALEYAKNRYEAHREMLEGLKSWKAFNEYGSDDLDFFLREQLPHAYAMHQEGKGDEAIVRYLEYRLADLYHFEERERN